MRADYASCILKNTSGPESAYFLGKFRLIMSDIKTIKVHSLGKIEFEKPISIVANKELKSSVISAKALFNLREISVPEVGNIKFIRHSFPIKMKQSDLKKLKSFIEGRTVNKPKKPIPIWKQVSRLRNEYGISFTYDEKADAQELLKRVDYYRLSVYKIFLPPERSFTDLRILYSFDLFLRQNISSLIPYVEIYIKSTLTNYLASVFTVDNKMDFNELEAEIYLSEKIYKNSYTKDGKVDEMLSEFYSLIRSKAGKDPSIDHLILFYGGHIPIWTLMEQLTLGQTAKFVECLDRSIRKQWISYMGLKENKRSISPKMIPSWIQTIQYMRNTVAHSSRVYGKTFTYSPSMLSEDMGPQNDVSTHSLYAGMCIIKRFISLMDNSKVIQWNQFVKQLLIRSKKNETLNIFDNLTFHSF